MSYTDKTKYSNPMINNSNLALKSFSGYIINDPTSIYLELVSMSLDNNMFYNNANSIYYASQLLNSYNNNLYYDLSTPEYVNGTAYSFNNGNAIAFLTNSGVGVTTDVNNFLYYFDKMISCNSQSSNVVNTIKSNYSDVWDLYCALAEYNNSKEANTNLSRIAAQTQNVFSIIGNDLNIMNTNAPPPGNCITSYCQKVVDGLVGIDGTVITLFDEIKKIAGYVDTAVNNSIDNATGVKPSQNAINYELNGAPILGKNGALSFQGINNLDFATALDAAEYQVFSGADNYVKGCNSGIAQTVKNASLAATSALFENILTIITNFAGLGASLAKVAIASKADLKIADNVAKYNAEVSSYIATSSNNVRCAMANYNTLHAGAHTNLSIQARALADITGILDLSNTVTTGNGISQQTVSAANNLVNDYKQLLTNLNNYLPSESVNLFSREILSTQASYLPTSCVISFSENDGTTYRDTVNLQKLFNCHWETVNLRYGTQREYVIGTHQANLISYDSKFQDPNCTSIMATLNQQILYDHGNCLGDMFTVTGNRPQTF